MQQFTKLFKRKEEGDKEEVILTLNREAAKKAINDILEDAKKCYKVLTNEQVEELKKEYLTALVVKNG